MNEQENFKNAYRIGIIGGILMIFGTVFPLLLSVWMKPKQPAWTSAEIFVEHYHEIP